ncbi:MAG: TolC family protein [Leptospirales bacterium]|nr:TolC family protein [Leptospirales bacterium]
MKHFKFVLLSVFITFAVETINTAEICKIDKATDAISCVLKKHPDIVQTQTQVSISSINKKNASRWLHPELEGEVGYSRAEEAGLAAEFAVLQTIETPTKRSARRAQADAEYAYAFALSEEQKEQATTQMLAILNRLRQINREKRILDETTNTFAEVIKRYRVRPALSPEDQVSVELFGFALNNYRIEKNQLDNEEKELLGTLKTILCCSVSAIQKIFLYSPKVWPKIDAGSIENSADLAKEQANITRAKADYLDRKSSSFDRFSVGPYIQTKPGNINKIETYGVKFAIPIPIYSNTKPVEAGRMTLSSAELGFETKKRELETGMENLKAKYSLGIKTLASYNIQGMEKHHARAKRLFDGGRVSGALLIEAHRQMVDSIKAYHQYEMETLQALWKIYALQRKLLTNLSEVYDENI